MANCLAHVRRQSGFPMDTGMFDDDLSNATWEDQSPIPTTSKRFKKDPEITQ